MIFYHSQKHFPSITDSNKKPAVLTSHRRDRPLHWWSGWDGSWQRIGKWISK